MTRLATEPPQKGLSTCAVHAQQSHAEALLTIDELVRRWKVSRRTIENEITRGALTPIFIRAARRFRLNDIEAYEARARGNRPFSAKVGTGTAIVADGPVLTAASPSGERSQRGDVGHDEQR